MCTPKIGQQLSKRAQCLCYEEHVLFISILGFEVWDWNIAQVTGTKYNKGNLTKIFSQSLFIKIMKLLTNRGCLCSYENFKTIANFRKIWSNWWKIRIVNARIFIYLVECRKKKKKEMYQQLILIDKEVKDKIAMMNVSWNCVEPSFVASFFSCPFLTIFRSNRPKLNMDSLNWTTIDGPWIWLLK